MNLVYFNDNYFTIEKFKEMYFEYTNLFLVLENNKEIRNELLEWIDYTIVQSIGNPLREKLVRKLLKKVKIIIKNQK